MSRRFRQGVLPFTVLAFCGCGGASPAPTPRLTISAQAQYEVRALVSSYEDALKAQDAQTACADMTPILQSQVVAETQRTNPSMRTCTQAMTLALRVGHAQILATLAKTALKSIAVSGSRATIVLTREGKPATSRALHEAAGWRLEESP